MLLMKVPSPKSEPDNLYGGTKTLRRFRLLVEARPIEKGRSVFSRMAHVASE